MSDIFKILGVVALTAFAAPAVAQDSGQPAAEAPAAEAPADAQPAAEAPAGPVTYVDGQFGDWQRECLRRPEGSEGKDPCRIVQILRDANQNPVGKIAVGRQPEGAQAAASAEVALPVDLGILLPQGLTLGVDKGLTKQYDFYMCLPGGCTARLLFSADDVTALKAGDVLRMQMVAFLPPDRQPTQIMIPV
ncbi:MAG: hypothetical protein D6801_00260, partial [Alphaproteobacteria bacterium]